MLTNCAQISLLRSRPSKEASSWPVLENDARKLNLYRRSIYKSQLNAETCNICNICNGINDTQLTSWEILQKASPFSLPFQSLRDIFPWLIPNLWALGRFYNIKGVTINFRSQE